MDVDTTPTDSAHVGLRALWGRRQADALLFRGAVVPTREVVRNEESNAVEHSEETENALTRLGLRYDLLTQYTPILAFDGGDAIAGAVGGKQWGPPVLRPPPSLGPGPFEDPCCPQGTVIQKFDVPYTLDRLKTQDPLVVEAGERPPYVDPGTYPVTGSPTLSTDERRVRLPDGTFIMGLTDVDSLDLQEAGRRKIAVSSFSVDRHEVTNAEYRTFLDSLSREARKQRRPDSTVWADVPIDVPWHTYFYGKEWSDHPVVGVTWADARVYCRAAGKRLPTEAEWEYAARGGRIGGVYPWTGLSPRDDQGQYRANFAPRDTARSADGHAFTAPVGTYPANPWDLYDVSGNVAEWVRDAYAPNYSVYEPRSESEGSRGSRDPIRDPVYEDSTAALRVVRGGSWASNAFEIGVGVRTAQAKDQASARIGFRCAADGPSTEGEPETDGPRPKPPTQAQPNGSPEPKQPNHNP
jgi:formylglycine-generating enzyme required for sulfatase activity